MSSKGKPKRRTLTEELKNREIREKKEITISLSSAFFRVFSVFRGCKKSVFEQERKCCGAFIQR